MKSQTTLYSLIKRGDRVSIEQGELVVTAASGVPVPPEWMALNKARLISEALELLDVSDAYVFKYYTTGRYGSKGIMGVTLQFQSLLTGESFYTVLNVSLKRSRNTKAGKKGSPLPDGQFLPPKDGLFCKLWASTGLKVPRYCIEYYKCMGKLASFHFVADVHAKEKDRLISSTIKPVNLSSGRIKEVCNRHS